MENKLEIIVALFLFILVIGVVSISTGVINKRQICPIVEERTEVPMLLVQMDEWGENMYDSSEILFDYWIYNFGLEEVKNISIRCEVTDYYDNLIREEIFNIGNVASGSYVYKESSMRYPSSSDNELGGCYLASANGEYINLYDRLTE